MKRREFALLAVAAVAWPVVVTIAQAETATVTSDYKFVDQLVADLGFQPSDLIERVRYLADIPSEAPMQRQLSYCVQGFADRIATDAKLREQVAFEVEQRACAQLGLCKDPALQQVDQSMFYVELLQVLASEMRGEKRAESSQAFKDHESFVEFGRHLARESGVEGSFRQASLVTGEISASYIRNSCPYSWKSWPILMSGLVGTCLLMSILGLVYTRRTLNGRPT